MFNADIYMKNREKINVDIDDCDFNEWVEDIIETGWSIIGGNGAINVSEISHILKISEK